MDALKSVSASHVADASVLAALVTCLQTKGILAEDDIREIYEHALLMIETEQSGPETVDIYEAARELIEEHLRPARA